MKPIIKVKNMNVNIVIICVFKVYFNVLQRLVYGK